MINPLEITYYAFTGYSPNDEPASDAVIDLNEHWTSPLYLKEYDPNTLQKMNLSLTDDELKRVDYLKIRDTVTSERWYYYVTGHRRLNEKVVEVSFVLDNFATVGLSNILFYGNIARRSLSAGERSNYPLLPEPWAPRRPLKMRRIILDLNVNKTIKLPSHISTTFEESSTTIDQSAIINVPTSALALTTIQDSLSVKTSLPIGYPNPAQDTTHVINTPWGDITYTTPFEEYLTLSGVALTTFLSKAKKYNSLDLVSTPYYLPNPTRDQTIVISEIGGNATHNQKSSRYYTTITIRSLASNATRTYSENEIDLQYNQPLLIVIAPDKDGGIYLMPKTLRDKGMNAYAYLEGVYSPFETIAYNAVGDTPGKFASDGTVLLNSALNELYRTYTQKTNALQHTQMAAKYLKDIGNIKNLLVSSFIDMGSYVNNLPYADQYAYQQFDRLTNSSNNISNVIFEMGEPGTQYRFYSSATGEYYYETVGANSAAWPKLKSILFGQYQNEAHSFMLGNINDYLNRYVSLQNDMHQGKIANLFKNITLIGGYQDYNKVAGKYEIIIASLQPDDEANFDLFLDHFGHAVDEYAQSLVTDVRDNYNYTMVGEDAVMHNSVKPDANAPILNQFRTGVRVWKKLIRPENF